MKKLITYDLFTEGVKDLMTPKSEDEIRKTLESKPVEDKIEFGIYKDIPWLVQQGVEEGADITKNDNFLLKWATEKGNLPLVKLLLDKGADIHTEDDRPLRNAVYLGFIDITKYLIEKGANINADRGYLVSLPVQKNDYEITELLLKSGANKSLRLNLAYKIAKDRKYDDIAELIKQYM